jgi:hypothetical protein
MASSTAPAPAPAAAAAPAPAPAPAAVDPALEERRRRFRPIYEAMDRYDFQNAARMCDRKEVSNTPLGKVRGSAEREREQADVNLAPFAHARPLLTSHPRFLRPIFVSAGAQGQVLPA